MKICRKPLIFMRIIYIVTEDMEKLQKPGLNIFPYSLELAKSYISRENDISALNSLCVHFHIILRNFTLSLIYRNYYNNCNRTNHRTTFLLFKGSNPSGSLIFLFTSSFLIMKKATNLDFKQFLEKQVCHLFLVETKRIELSTLRMRTVRSPI